MNPKLSNGNISSYPAPETSSPLLLESAGRVTIPIALLADDDASGASRLGLGSGKFSFQKIVSTGRDKNCIYSCSGRETPEIASFKGVF